MNRADACNRCIAQALVAPARGQVLSSTCNAMVDRIEAELERAFHAGRRAERKAAKAKAGKS